MAINRRVKEIVDSISKDRYVHKINGRDLANPKIGLLKYAYIFSYPKPKTIKSLPYFDETPIILIIARQGSNKVLGLNLNHVPYTLAINLAKSLEKKAKNKKRSIKYADIKEAIIKAKLPKVFYMVAIKSYLLDRIAGYVIPLEMGEYSQALIKIPRNFKKKGVGEAMRLNNAKVFSYIRKMKNKGNK